MYAGNGLPVFTGSRYPSQAGAGILGNIARMALPLLKRIGRSALRHGASALSSTVADALSGGENWKSAALRNAKAMAKNTTLDVLKGSQQGEGIRKTRKKHKVHKKKRVVHNKFKDIFVH